MSNSIFSNIGGDAVDVSGGDIVLSDMMIQDVKDKGISAGEGSKVKIELSKISRVGVGIASKDGSEVKAESTFIEESKLFDLMTYSKKSFFNNSKLLFNNDSQEVVTSARQRNTYLNINDSEAVARKLDVEKLYETSVMSK